MVYVVIILLILAGIGSCVGEQEDNTEKQTTYMSDGNNRRNSSGNSDGAILSLTPVNSYSEVDLGDYRVYSDPQENWFYWQRITYDAIKSEDYNRATAAIKNEIKAFEDYDKIDIILASSYLKLSMLYWSVGSRNNAISALKQTIYYMQNGRNLGGSGCEQRAQIFLQKMRSGDLPDYFTPQDISSNIGVSSYIMEIPDAVYQRQIDKLKAHYDAIANRTAAATDVYRKEGNLQARMARYYADSEYQKTTGRTFYPDSPPSYGSKDREAWDACKRVYDIFE
ncbi:MAG: hypothetical protein IKD23_03525 [Lentisphaeria bacterium]|nr:hypothetical protein [Lentisphaeria bacterium]